LIILEGTGVINLGRIYIEYTESKTVLILQGEKYRIENKGSEKVVFIGVQTGPYFRYYI